MDSAALRAVIREAAEMGVFRLVFSGGEPFLRPDLPELLLHALRSRVGRVFVSTNGSRVVSADLRPLLPFRERLTFKISLDGPPEFHDSLRGHVGAFAGAVSAIGRLVQVGFDVQVTTTVMSDNIRHLPWLLARVAILGASRHMLVEVVPVGHASLEMVPTPEQRAEAAAVLHLAADKFNSGRYRVAAKLAFLGSGFGFRCAAGFDECGVLADGSVVGCRLMPDMVEGNVHTTSLAALWAAPGRFGAFRRLSPADLPAGCARCSQVASCLGGCRAYARAVSGDPLGADPRCPRVLANHQR